MQLLQERYENKPSIVQAHLQIILSQPSLKMESSSGFQKILDTTNELLNPLADLGQPVVHCDSLLVFWLAGKTDSESRKQWQLDHPGTDLLTWAELAKFLDTRSRALETGPVVNRSHSQPHQSASLKGKKNTIVFCCYLSWLRIRT